MNDNKKNIRDVEALIDGMGANFEQNFEKWVAEQPPMDRCLPLTRARDLAFEPARMSAEERSHVAGCGSCTRLLEKMALQLHPTPVQLLAAVLEAEGANLAAVQCHAQGCDRCQWMRSSGLMARVAEFCRAAARPLELLNALGGNLLARTLPVAPPAAAFGEEPAVEAAGLRQGALTVSLDSDGPDLLVTVALEGSTAEYTSVAVWLRGEGGMREVEIGLKPSGGMLAGGVRVENIWRQPYHSVDLEVTALPWRPSAGNTR